MLILTGAGIFLEIKFKEHLFRHLKARLFWALFWLAVTLLWDVYAVPNRHWVFTGKGIIGLYIGIFPFEEILWYFVVPYFCLTVYEAAHGFMDHKRRRRAKIK